MDHEAGHQEVVEEGEKKGLADEQPPGRGEPGGVERVAADRVGAGEYEELRKLLEAEKLRQAPGLHDLAQGQAGQPDGEQGGQDGRQTQSGGEQLPCGIPFFKKDEQGENEQRQRYRRADHGISRIRQAGLAAGPAPDAVSGRQAVEDRERRDDNEHLDEGKH